MHNLSQVTLMPGRAQAPGSDFEHQSGSEQRPRVIENKEHNTIAYLNLSRVKYRLPRVDYKMSLTRTRVTVFGATFSK